MFYQLALRSSFEAAGNWPSTYQAQSMRFIMKARANSEISSRSDAESSGETTEGKISDIEKRTRYRIALMRTDLSTFSEVSWPTPISE